MTIEEEAKNAVKISRKTFFNPRGWLGYDSLKIQTNMLWRIVRSLFVPAAPKRRETFEQALERLNITEEILQRNYTRYLFVAVIFAGLGVATILFGFWLLFHHHTFSGFILSIPTAGLFLVNAFRYHFWVFQIKHRKLGCTFNEWWQGRINHDDGNASL